MSAIKHPVCICSLFLAAALLSLAGPAHGQATVPSLTPTIKGYRVGGVTVEVVRNVYVADLEISSGRLRPKGNATNSHQASVALPALPST